MSSRNQLIMQFLSCIMMLMSCVDDQTNAFTIQLIHRYAPESPFYNANLTYDDIVDRLTKTSKPGVNLINSTSTQNKTLFDLNGIRPMMHVEHGFSPYLVKVSLGTFHGGRSSRRSYFLELDTASDLIWLQCEDCMKDPNYGFRQIEPPFPNSKSSSYKPLPCDQHPLCYPNQCMGDSCSYYVTYADDSYSWGILARESFAFPSTSGREEIVKLVYGCGLRNHYSYYQDQELKLAGTFGLSWGDRSFVNQIHSISEGRFSYCLPPIVQAARGTSVYLRFGSDIPSYYSLDSTRLLQYDHQYAYYVNLVDISVNGNRLNIPSWYLDKRDRTSGCILDTGTAPTLISPPAYDILKMAVITHIAGYVQSLKMVGPMSKYNLCYKKSKQRREEIDLPSITFHFENNAALVVEPEIAFTHNVQDKHICFSMIPNDEQDGRTVLGSDIQANQFMVYDLPRQTLYFGRRDCSRDH